MARLVNMHTAPLDNARHGQHAARVPPGQVGDFDEANPSVQLWKRARLLVSEGEVLASRAAALGDAPSLAEMVTLREQLATREAVIEDLHARLAARDGERARMEDALGKHAQRTADLEAQLAEVLGASAMGAATVEQRDAAIAALQQRVAGLEADLATATEPKGTGSAADTTLDPKATKPRGR